jgi:hypothetical protein
VEEEEEEEEEEGSPHFNVGACQTDQLWIGVCWSNLVHRENASVKTKLSKPKHRSYEYR